MNNQFEPTRFVKYSETGLEYVIGAGLFHKKREGNQVQVYDDQIAALPEKV
jgi:hypothetical protein